MYNESSLDIVILAVTSKVGKSLGIGEWLVQDWKAAGLLKPSAIKSALSTIEQALVLKKLGALSPKDMESLKESLRDLFDLK